MKATEEELTRKEQPLNQLPGWREVLHPSSPVVAARQIPPFSQGSKWRHHSRSSGERIVQCQWADETLKAQNINLEPTSPTRVLDVAWHVTPPPGFQGVMACLQRSPSSEKACDIPPDPLQIAAVMEPTMVAMMSTSCIVKDKATGVTYMDTIATSMGRVALSGPETGDPNQGAHHRGHHRPHMMNWPMTTFGQKGRMMTTFRWKD